MGTRANITIKNGKTNIIFYRHYDGYLECCGADLLEKLQVTKWEDNSDCKNWNINRFISMIMNDSNYRIDSVDNHGDLEYAYIFKFKDNYEHSDHYNRAELTSITVDQDHEFGEGGKQIHRHINQFSNQIKQGEPIE